MTPKFRDVPVPVDFVALLDRQSPRDHLADYNMQVIATLRDGGLFVELAEFDDDPSLCRIARTGEFVRLDTLVHRVSDSVFLLFASPEQLIDPASDRLRPAVLALKNARRKVLLTPRLVAGSSGLERQLSRRLGLIVIATTPDSIGTLKSLLLETGRLPVAASDRDNGRQGRFDALFDFMEERPGRWMQSIGPRSADRRRLSQLLRAALGSPGLSWLSAVTVYPELRWPLTLSLKAIMDGTTQRRPFLDGELLAVSRLPWFRRGWMPDWSRSLLQDALSEEQRRKARRTILDAIGLGQSKGGRGGENLDVHLDDPASGQTSRMVKADGIMIEFLWPLLRSMRRLFVLPTSWLRHMARKPVKKLAAAAVVGLAVAAPASFLTLSLVPIDNCDLLQAPFTMIFGSGQAYEVRDQGRSSEPRRSKPAGHLLHANPRMAGTGFNSVACLMARRHSKPPADPRILIIPQGITCSEPTMRTGPRETSNFQNIIF